MTQPTPATNMKGTFCPFDEKRFCQEGECQGCQVYLDAVAKANDGLCPVCGAEKELWAELFGEVHHCEPEWARGRIVR